MAVGLRVCCVQDNDDGLTLTAAAAAATSVTCACCWRIKCVVCAACEFMWMHPNDTHAMCASVFVVKVEDRSCVEFEDDNLDIRYPVQRRVAIS